MSRVLLLTLLALALSLPAGAAPSEPQIIDGCGDVGTGVTLGGGSEVLVTQERDRSFDIDHVRFTTVRDADSETPIGVGVTMITCADRIPEPELFGSAWQVRWDTPDNELDERCNATVILNDSVSLDDAAEGITRGASLFQTCSRQGTALLGVTSATSYTAHTSDLGGAVVIDGGTITWTILFDEIDSAIAAFVAPGLDVTDPVARTRDGRRVTYVGQSGGPEVHLAAGDETAPGTTYTIGS